MLKSSFEFNLSEPIKYSGKKGESQGKFVDSSLLVLYGPRAAQMALASKIKSLFYATFKSSEKETTAEPTGSVDEPKKPGLEIENHVAIVMALDKESKTGEALELFKTLICNSDLCKIDGEAKLTTTVFETFLYEDLCEIFGRYMEYFLAQSFVRAMEAST